MVEYIGIAYDKTNKEVCYYGSVVSLLQKVPTVEQWKKSRIALAKEEGRKIKFIATAILHGADTMALCDASDIQHEEWRAQGLEE